VLCHDVLPPRSRIRAADAKVKSGQLDATSSRARVARSWPDRSWPAARV